MAENRKFHVKKYILKDMDFSNIAYVIDDRIYVDRILKKRPSMIDKVLKHEVRHVGEKSVWKDLMNDWNNDEAFTFTDYLFLLRHKPLYIFLSPFWFIGKEGKTITIDYSRLINVIVLAAIIGLAFLYRTIA